MKISLPNTFLYQFLFVLCIAVTYFDNYEATFIAWSLSFLITIKKTYSLEIVKMIAPYLLIIFIAFISTFGKDHKPYFIIRDITYLIKPVMGFLVGYQIFKSGIKKPFELIANAALIVSIYHIILIANAFLFEGVRNMNDLRLHAGYFSDFEVYAIIILLFYKKFGIEFSKQKVRLYIIIVGFSAFMYLARTNFIQFAVLYLAVKGYFSLNKKSIVIFASVLLFTIIGYSAVVYSNPRRDSKGIEALFYKIKVAPLEPFKTKIDKDDYKDFNDNYRSYENIRTLSQIGNQGAKGVIIGKGLGSTVDLQQKVNLGGTELRFISILHNGFMIVLLKAGIVGIFVYLFTIFYFFKRNKDADEREKYINLLFLGTGIFLIISNWVFLGFYNLTETKSILIGLCLGYRQAIRK